MRKLLFLILILLTSGKVYADQIFMNNGDRLTGTVITSDTSVVKADIKGIGAISIDRGIVEKIVTDADLAKEALKKAEEEKKDGVDWSGELSAGFDRRRGNTSSTELFGEAKLAAETELSKYAAKGRLFYSEENRKMNAQKYKWSSRYDRRFRDMKKLYGYVTVESDRDRFANIKLRYTPGAGLGYHIAENERLKLQAETALAYTYTSYKDDTEVTHEFVLVPRAYGELKLIGDSKVTEDFTIYPSMTESGEYRWVSETVFHAPLNESVALKFHLIDEFNSNPGGTAKKNDLRIISTIAYTF